MSRKINIFFLIFLIPIISFYCSSIRSNSKAKVYSNIKTPKFQIDIYHESLCPFCREFTTGSVQDLLKYENLRKLIKINFHPYGKTTNYSQGNNFKFICQHGENECFGNKIQLCGMKKFDEENGVNFVVCMETAIEMTYNNMNTALNSCVSEKLSKEILECANGQEGNFLMNQEAQKTPQILDHVPYVTFNGIYNPDNEEDIRNSLKDFICRQAQDLNLPECRTINY